MWHDGVLIPTSEGAGVTSPVSAPCLCDDSPLCRTSGPQSYGEKHKGSAQCPAVLGEEGLRGWCLVYGPGLPSRSPTKQRA